MTWCGVPEQVITSAKAIPRENVEVPRPSRAAPAAGAAAPRLSDAIGTPTVDTGREHQNRPRHVRYAQRQSAGTMSRAAGSVADATGNWVDTLAPRLAAPLPAACAPRSPDRLLAVAAALLVVVRACRDRRACAPARASAHIALFFIGAFAMRGAGCTWNDIVDRDLDAQRRAHTLAADSVRARSASRKPRLFLRRCRRWSGLPCCSHFNAFTIALGIASLAIVAVYPFMKRITYWPQIVLGLAFSWGALMGWAGVVRPRSICRRSCSMPARSPG